MANGKFKHFLYEELRLLDARHEELIEKRDAIISAKVDADKISRQLNAITLSLVKIQQAKTTINDALTAYKKWKKEE